MLNVVDQWMHEFGDQRGSLETAAMSIHNAVLARLKDDGLNYHVVQWRVKDNESLRTKLQRTSEDGAPKYQNGLNDVDDMIGLRIITYLQGDVDRATEALGGSFDVLEYVDKTAQQKAKGQFGYSGQHMVLQISESGPPPGCSDHRGQRFEVQFRTILQHAWAEFEHDVRYKGDNGSRPEVDRAFTLASGLIELADREFSHINTIVGAQKAEDELAEEVPDRDLSPAGLEALLEQYLPDHPRSRTEQYTWLIELLQANDVTTVSAAADLLQTAKWEVISDKIAYKFHPGHVRIVDDYLLYLWDDDYIARTQNIGDDANRREKLVYRLNRLSK